MRQLPPIALPGLCLAPFLGLLLGLLPLEGAAAPTARRFFIMGPGTLKIRSTKNRHRFNGRLRDRRGAYLPAALRQINRVIGGAHDDPERRISLRLVEVLAHLQQALGGDWITISSGYRSPTYNQKLRDRGGTVARASLHLYGMAVDLRLEGVDSRLLWERARADRVGGAGYYGSPWIHLDVGPPRAWTQGTANVRTGQSDDNQRLILVPEFDSYAPGETLRLCFARMTAFPIGVRQRALVLERRAPDGSWSAALTFAPRFPGKRAPGCRQLASTAEMLGITWRLPPTITPGRYRVRASFCAVRWKRMPRTIVSSEIEVAR